MWARIATGAAALGLYGWRLEDPKASYAAFYDFADWLTGWAVEGEGIWLYLRRAVNLALVDQADGFLLGVACFALLTLVLWPFRACGRWCVRKIARVRQGV